MNAEDGLPGLPLKVSGPFIRIAGAKCSEERAGIEPATRLSG